MRINVKTNIDTGRILRQRGMGGTHELRRYLAARVKLYNDPYTPMQTGALKNTAVISADGSELVYRTPYARYQYYGEVYGPNFLTSQGWRSGPVKHPTGRPLTYHGAPMRGKLWHERMMRDRARDLKADVAAYLNRRAQR